ncbi:hypothetical protein [Halobacteriovorax sp. YZS-1-1]|uniref:hypothetical protein n=1 Tax=unclassified Halobacteriovorax TaxID=2639665 RepID=UPI00399B567B
MHLITGMREILFITFLCSLNVFADIDFTIEKSFYQDHQIKYDAKELTYNSEYNESSYWFKTKYREFIIGNIVNCLENNCTTYHQRDLDEIYNESQNQFGEKDAQVYFSNVVAGLVISADDSLERQNILSEAKEYMNFNQKIYIGHILGHMMNNHYDHDRDPDGIVSQDEIYRAQRNGYDAGVCRDIAVAQATVLKDLGISETYILAYATAGDGHAMVIAQDPDNKDRIVSLNYGEVRINESPSAQGLSQDSSLADFGISYRIFNADGTPHDRLSTELGYVLNKVLGFDNNLSSPGSKFDGINFSSVDYTKGIFTATAFYSDNASGLNTLGAGVSLRRDTEHLTLNAGATGYHSRKSLKHREFHSQSIGIFGGIEAQLRTGKTDFGFLKNIYADTRVLVSGSMGKGDYSNEKLDENNEIDALDGDYFRSEHHMLASSLYAESNFANMTWRGIVTAHASIMKDDIRNESHHSLHYLGTTIKNQFNTPISDEYTLTLENTLYLKQNGSTMDFNAEVRSGDDLFSFQLGTSRPISGQTGYWTTGHEKETYFKLKANSRDNRFSLGLKIGKTESHGTTYRLESEFRF